METDYHAHSDYSDGMPIEELAEAAEEAGLSRIYIADHYRNDQRERNDLGKKEWRKRRDEMNEVENGVSLVQALEIDNEVLKDEERCRDYQDARILNPTLLLGGVHYIEDEFVRDFESYQNPEAVVDQYFNDLVELSQNSAVDILPHPDLIELNGQLMAAVDTERLEKGYRRMLENRNPYVIPEVSGKIQEKVDGGHSVFVDVLKDSSDSFIFGTDAHRPQELSRRKQKLEEVQQFLGREPSRGLV